VRRCTRFGRRGQAVKGCDTVFHTAAIISHWSKERAAMYDIQCAGTRWSPKHAFAAMLQKFVHTSSIATIGPAAHDEIMTENTPTILARSRGYRATKRLQSRRS